MNQNLLSRIFGAGSVYEQINEDAESIAGYHAGQSTYSPSSQSHYAMSFHPYNAMGKSRAHFDNDEGVPESLLYEAREEVEQDNSATPARRRGESAGTGRLPPRPDEIHVPLMQPPPLLSSTRLGLNNSKDHALWRWANVQNLDVFLQEVYAYFLGNGIWSILLSRTLNLLTLAFVTSFSTYLGACIDYSKVRSSSKLSEIQVERCMARLDSPSVMVLWLLITFWIIKILQYASDIRNLWEMHNFYVHLLGITELDMQTISWPQIVNKLLALRDSNPITSNNKHTQSKERMDAHDIANRIMRKENYLIAMFNKNILNLVPPLPFLNQPMLTRTIQWNLNLCILAYVFDEQGQIRRAFVKGAGVNRKALIESLRRRFIFAGIMNAIFAPFIIIYLLLVHFFRYFNEYHKNPSALGSRQYTPLAQITFREFNELHHIFYKRLNLSHQYANRYVSQFPNDKTMQVARFTSFIAGSFAAVLALASLIDPDLFLGFEITHDRTVLFYIGLFGTIVAISRSMVPDGTSVFDPEAALHQVVEYTHYCPKDWFEKMHSHEVKAEFCKLYDYKLIIFLQEIISVLITPIILWFSLPFSSERIIDFIRDCTVHVDGIGYVCCFALFDFTKGETSGPSTDTPTKPAMIANDNKMEKSFLNFKASHPDWVPDPSGSMFLQSLQGPGEVAQPLASPTRRRYGPLTNSHILPSGRNRRGHASTMHSTMFLPPAHLRYPSRISEEEPRENHAMLGDSYLDAGKKLKEPTRVDDEDTKLGAGVLGLMHQFYHEAQPT